MIMKKKIGLLGGTFDPIHNGHLRAALEIKTILQLDEIIFIPCKQSVLKPLEPSANAEQRMSMLQLAIAHEKGFKTDDRELVRDSPSFMIETLISLRQENPDVGLYLLLGGDAFLGLPAWHRWRELLDYAHLIVMARPGYPLALPSPLDSFFNEHKLDDTDELEQNTHGFIYVQDITPLGISASAIRHQLKAQLSPRFLLPDEVLAYIIQQHIY
jgi:nicotinate-nucleotide adenylyltransferase